MSKKDSQLGVNYSSKEGKLLIRIVYIGLENLQVL